MDFEFSDKVRDLQERVTRFMDEHIYPLEPDYPAHVKEAGGWTTPPIMDKLKERAREALPLAEVRRLRQKRLNVCPILTVRSPRRVTPPWREGPGAFVRTTCPGSR